ncbi:reverse transcriptase domain-containing protein [Tanacetum coccineum]|uniref:Reverse transcriptase domain-containing protein n=1 Tax=Tanacetum coccineum TaxID=301880 RepID=A0ABQ5IJW5_9ASTR
MCRGSYALSWKPCQGDSLNLPDHRYKRRCCSPIPAKSDSLPHAHTQAFKVNHSASRLLILNFLIIKELQSQIKNSLLGKIVFRSKNKRADALSKLVSSFFAHLTKNVPVEVIPYKSIEIYANNTVEDGGGRRKGYSAPWLRCVGPNQAHYVLQEAHFGSCRAHAGARTIVQKAAMYCDATQHLEPMAILPIGNRPGWTFSGSPGRVKFLVVAIDYFTKWVEAAPLATITGKNILKFIWSNIVCRFGIPGVIISDNRKQFAENPFRDWCNELKIKQKFTSVAHPQENGQIENEATRQEGHKKLDPNWEGPYQIIEAKRPGTYVLKDLHGKLIPKHGT